MSRKKLRFAPLIRVSGEEQARYGESLRTQRRQIEEAVDKLGGVIPAALAGKYTGQEHATPGYERERFDQLLKDAEAGLFDAVMVADISRWSRDNEKSEAGLKSLRRNGVRFFVLGTEHDLENPEAELALSMFSTINRYLARTQNKKAADNRLARLRRGCPANGALPYGRTFDKGTETWGVDPDARKKIQAVAKRYIAGDSLTAMGQEFQHSTSSLWRALVKQSGPEFVVTWNKPDPERRERLRHRAGNTEDLVKKHRRRAKQVHERVKEIELEDRFIFIITVPPLLDDETLEKVRQVADRRRKGRGKRVNKYLLGGYVFCAECGLSFCGQTQKGSYRYYRHHPGGKINPDKCPQNWMVVKANELEEAVLLHLFATLGNPAKIQRAIEAANPDAEAQEDARQEIEGKLGELKKIDVAMERLVKAVADGVLEGDDVRRRKDRLVDEADAIKARIQALKEIIADAPTPAAVKTAAKHLAKSSPLAASLRKNVKRRASVRSAMGREELERMTYEDKKALVDLFFSGNAPDNSPFGVYVTRGDDYRYRGRNPSWKFEIRGRFTIEPVAENMPLSDRQREYLLGEADTGSARKNLQEVYSSLSPSYAACRSSQCHRSGRSGRWPCGPPR